MTATVRGSFALILAAASLLLGSGAAFAHTGLVGTTPGDGGTADRAVTSITLTFDAPLAPELADVVVVGEDGTDRDVGEPVVQASEVTVPVRPLDVAGGYAVSYRVVAIDGHPVSGSYRFSVSAPSAREAQSVSGQPPLAPGAAPAVATLAGASSWGDLAPELGLVFLTSVIFGVAMVRRSRVRQDVPSHA